MNYNKLIEETTNKINDPDIDDELYDGIFNEAKLRLGSSYDEGIKSINADYKAKRRNAIGENAVATKSLREELASRGLALSGESAMLSINQSIALRNTVADLARAALTARTNVTNEYNKGMNELEKEQASMKAAAREKEKDRLNDRLIHLEKLQADDKKWQADYALEVLKEENKAKENQNKGNTSQSGGSGGSSGSGGQKTEIQGGFPEVTPSLTPLQTANRIMEKCAVYSRDGEIPMIYSTVSQNKIRKELAREACVMGISEDYLTQVLSVLVSHGFDGNFDMSVATGKPLKWVYATYDSATTRNSKDLPTKKWKVMKEKTPRTPMQRKRRKRL